MNSLFRSRRMCGLHAAVVAIAAVITAASFPAAAQTTPKPAQSPTRSSAPPPTQTPSQTPAQPASQSPAAQTNAGPAIPAGVPSSDGHSQYIIGPGDVIQIFVWRSPELTVSVPVRPDGKVSSPLVEDMIAVGKTPTQLARDVETRLAEYIRSPQVSIIVTTPLSTFNQVKVIGQVRNPQALSYREGMTVLDAILAVGGLTDFAAGNRARIVRKEGDTEKSITVRIQDVVNKGKLSENKALKPGDLLIVPESIF